MSPRKLELHLLHAAVTFCQLVFFPPSLMHRMWSRVLKCSGVAGLPQ